MTHLLDTDHVSILERRGGSDYLPVVTNLNLHAVEDVGLCVVSLQEQFRGAQSLISRAKTTAELIRGYQLFYRVIDEFRSFSLVSFDSVAGIQYEALVNLRLRISSMDLRIASIALANDLTLVTRNRSDFEKVPGLRIEDWTK